MDSYLQIFTHFFSDYTKANTREVVDRETSILGVVQGEYSAAAPFHFIVLETFGKGLQAHCLRHLVEHDLDEDTATRSGIIFGEFDSF